MFFKSDSAALLGLIMLLLSGCSVVNFSGNYYDLPPNYHAEIKQLWQKMMRGIAALRILIGM